MTDAQYMPDNTYHKKNQCVAVKFLTIVPLLADIIFLDYSGHF